MARLFLLTSLLEEAYNLDSYRSHRLAQKRRGQEKDYVDIYRLSGDIIDNLLEEIIPLLKKPQRKGRTLTARTKLLCTLSFLANGSYQTNIVGKSISNLSQASASRCIHQIVEVLSHPEIVRKFIRFPQNAEERLALKKRFKEKYNIPDVICCVDATFAAIVKPTENDERYYCGKVHHGRIIQLFTDADHYILHVDATYGGATHESYIFDNSQIKTHLQGLINAGETVRLLADSEYPQRSYLMTPVSDAEEGSKEEYYNKIHSTAHSTANKTIEILKGRFRCLLVKRSLHYDPTTAGKIVIACCVLHNICNKSALVAPALSSGEKNTEKEFCAVARKSACRIDDSSQKDLTLGETSRKQFIDELWNARSTQ